VEIFNLYALADERRIVREREARFERLRRRKPRLEAAPRTAEPRRAGSPRPVQN